MHATRGVIRDQRTRRKAMIVLLALATSPFDFGRNGTRGSAESARASNRGARFLAGLHLAYTNRDAACHFRFVDRAT